MRWILLSLLLLAGCSPTARIIGFGCEDDPYFQITKVDGKLQACYDDRLVRVTMENGAEQDVEQLLIVIQGDAGSVEAVKDVKLNRGFAVSARVAYEVGEIALPRDVAVTPIVNGRECRINMRTAPLRHCE
ncbi:MAG: hypothetical protein KJ709_08995 [Nanoarchaeota archaeon]|nr:hypothetical protein [Nanoarchaeota archaeon]